MDAWCTGLAGNTNGLIDTNAGQTTGSAGCQEEIHAYSLTGKWGLSQRPDNGSRMS